MQPSGDIQFQQHQIDGGCGQASVPDDIVDLHRRRAEGVGDAGAVGIIRRKRAPNLCAISSSRCASASLAIRIARVAPPLAESSGNMASAASAEPK
jgi:hypothetical protein